MKTIHLECDKIRYAEFPELKFGSTPDNKDYFDMTQYLIDKELTDTHNVTKFQQKFFFHIVHAQTAYELSPEETIIRNEKDNHDLIAMELGLLFIMYTDPLFLSYTLDRMDEMLIQGMVLSDTALQQLHTDRFQFLANTGS